MIKVVFADDSALMRREIKRLLDKQKNIELVGVAKDGQEGLNLVLEHEPDVVLLDINMPNMDGITALQRIMMESPRPVIMLSSLTQDGSDTTYECLEVGAVDFIAKPGGTVSKNLYEVEAEIISKIESASIAITDSIRNRRVRRLKRGQDNVREQQQQIKSRKEKKGQVPPENKIVVIGQSTGGPNTSMDIIPYLPKDLTAPVVIIQHMPANFTPSFAERLNKNCAFPFKEIKMHDLLELNHGYLAPGSIHSILKLTKNKDGLEFKVTQYPKDTLHSPSVDVTMDSILEIYGENVIGVLLTGMGADGADAMAKIKKAGGKTICESEETAIVFGMPKEAIKRGGADYILPSYEIADKITELVFA